MAYYASMLIGKTVMTYREENGTRRDVVGPLLGH
jgi:hypothetical protein